MKKALVIFNQKRFEWVLAAVVMLPLLWLNTRHSQHWGDDFAVYIQQAKNISEGRPFDESSYRILPGFNSLVAAAPIGYSLLLVPVYRLAGLDIYPYTLLQAVLYVCWALVSFYLARKHFGLVASLVFLFACWYPNFMLWLKLLVTSDVAFSLLILLVCVVLHRSGLSPVRWLLCGLLLGIATLFRPVGIVFAVAGVAYILYRYPKPPADATPVRHRWIALSSVSLLPMVVVFVVNRLFPSRSDYVGFTLDMIKNIPLSETLPRNLCYYAECYMELFRSTSPEHTSVSMVAGWCALLLTLAGMAMRLRQPLQFFDFAAGAYLCFILMYPVITDYRYLAPVHAMLFLYLFTALRFAAQAIRHPARRLLTPALLLFFVFEYSHHLEFLAVDTHAIVVGPYEPDAQRAFEAVRKLVPDGETVLFSKPRALALFSGRQTTYWNLDWDAEQNYRALKAAGVNYFLWCSTMQNAPYRAIVEGHRHHMKPVYEGGNYALLLDTMQHH